MLEREKEYKKIFNENNKKYNKKDIIEILLKSNYNDLENLNEEIEILNLDEKNIKEYLQLLDYLHKMYKDEKNIDKEKIEEYYKKICRTMCENAIIKISNSNKDMINEKKSEILSSLLYYNNHSIENLIDINKSGINCLLEKEIKHTKSTKSKNIKQTKTTKKPSKTPKNRSRMNKTKNI